MTLSVLQSEPRVSEHSPSPDDLLWPTIRRRSPHAIYPECEHIPRRQCYHEFAQFGLQEQRGWLERYAGRVARQGQHVESGTSSSGFFWWTLKSGGGRKGSAAFAVRPVLPLVPVKSPRLRDCSSRWVWKSPYCVRSVQQTCPATVMENVAAP